MPVGPDASPHRLSDDTLHLLKPGVSIPSYDRSRLTAGILHFGVGNFHRAHQADYLNDLFDSGLGMDWAIVGAGVTPSDERMRSSLLSKDCLTSIVEQSADHSKAKITGSMIDMLPIGDCQAIIGKLLDPQIRIVSLTITEGGYFLDPSKGTFDANDPRIIRDTLNLQSPSTVFGLVALGLKARRQIGLEPFTIMSCDNIPRNGEITRSVLAGFARLTDPELADWIQRNVQFPNSMVDRITPAVGERERRLIKEEFRVDDPSPVFCEAFKQWILEDRFSTGRPALERVGVEFVDDVSAYEEAKLRILNGGHAVLAYPAALLGKGYVHEAMTEPIIRSFFEKVQTEEIVPTVPPIPGTDHATYFLKVCRRFENPKILDTVHRLCHDGSNRQPKFVIPTLSDSLATGGSVRGLALTSALWCRYCFGIDELGREIERNDPNWDRLTAAARAARSDPRQWLSMGEIYGGLGENELFADEFASSLKRIWADGTANTLLSYIKSGQ